MVSPTRRLKKGQSPLVTVKEKLDLLVQASFQVVTANGALTGGNEKELKDNIEKIENEKKELLAELNMLRSSHAVSAQSKNKSPMSSKINDHPLEHTHPEIIKGNPKTKPEVESEIYWDTENVTTET